MPSAAGFALESVVPISAVARLADIDLSPLCTAEVAAIDRVNTVDGEGPLVLIYHITGGNKLTVVINEACERRVLSVANCSSLMISYSKPSPVSSAPPATAAKEDTKPNAIGAGSAFIHPEDMPRYLTALTLLFADLASTAEPPETCLFERCVRIEIQGIMRVLSKIAGKEKVPGSKPEWAPHRVTLMAVVTTAPKSSSKESSIQSCLICCPVAAVAATEVSIQHEMVTRALLGLSIGTTEKKLSPELSGASSPVQPDSWTPARFPAFPTAQEDEIRLFEEDWWLDEAVVGTTSLNSW
jgi:hypothetical protein